MLTNAQLAIVTIARLALNIAFRIIYPLQPFLTNQLNVDLQTVSMLVTVQLLASLFSPLGGTLADTRGERFTMSVGLSIFCIGTIICIVAGGFGGFLAGYALIGLAMSLYQPSATAYLSARTPYTRRGWALGVYETSWAGAALIGVAPLMQVVQVTQSATPVYWVLSGLGVAALAMVRLMLPPTPQRQRQPGVGMLDWRALANPSVVAILSVMTLVMFGYDLYGVAQGPWLKQFFQASEGMLGQTFLAAGVAELIGSVAVAFLVDRIGKRRAAFGGFIVAGLALALLPTATSWEMLLGLLFVFFLAEEFAIVAALPLVSGVAPTARGTVVALTIVTTSIGRAVGAALSPILFQSTGIVFNTTVAAVLTCTAALIGFLLVREAES
jgi:predicted MFS family arabinose efflux permease